MSFAFDSHFLLRCAVAAALAAACSVAAAQSVRPAPAPRPAAPTFGLPNPAGLPSPSPAPAGLPSPNPVNLSNPGTAAPGSPPIDDGIAQPIYPGGGAGYATGLPQTNVMGAGVGVAAAGGRWSVVDLARAFIEADRNRDGELTRAEASRLAITPMSFEDMDRNRDGILSRFEYDDATR